MPKKFGDKEKEIIKNRLMDIGVELFSKYGLQKTSINDLTKAVGIAQGSFYNFYDSKEELYFKILESEEEIIEQHMKKSILATNSAKEALKITILETYTIFEKTAILRRIYESNDYEIMMRKLPSEKLEKHQIEDTKLVIDTIMKVKHKNEEIIVEPEIISGILRGITLLNLHREEIGMEIYPKIVEILAVAVADGLVKKIKE